MLGPPGPLGEPVGLSLARKLQSTLYKQMQFLLKYACAWLHVYHTLLIQPMVLKTVG